MSNQNPLFEGSKWKEQARKGELSQKSFDILKGSSVGKKYLNPLNVIYNKRKGQKLELEKLRKRLPFNLSYNYSLKHPVKSRADQKPLTGDPIIYLADPKNNRVKKISTPLQRELIRQHEMDEVIAFQKMFQKGDYWKRLNDNKKIVDTKYSKKLFDKIKSNLKDGKYNNRRSMVRDIDNYGLAAKGYTHEPGVLNREFETRNLLYPSNKETTKSKAFIGGKYTITNKHKRSDDEIEYGKQKPDKRILFNKGDTMPKVFETMKDLKKKLGPMWRPPKE